MIGGAHSLWPGFVPCVAIVLGGVGVGEGHKGLVGGVGRPFVKSTLAFFTIHALVVVLWLTGRQLSRHAQYGGLGLY